MKLDKVFIFGFELMEEANDFGEVYIKEKQRFKLDHWVTMHRVICVMTQRFNSKLLHWNNAYRPQAPFQFSTLLEK